MRATATWLVAFSFGLMACGADETAVASKGAAGASTRAPVVAVQTAGFEDPEPPDAQARAESVVLADFNRNKTTRLVMNITTLVGRTSELSGFSTATAPREEKIEDTLSRLGAKVTESEVRIQLPGSILFDFDSADVRPDASRTLGEVVQVIRSYAQRPVRIDGHTDSIASDDYNRALSERRARAVLEWLVANGVERPRLAAAGQGETQPVASNDSAAGRQLNRRVEIVIARK